MTLTETPVATPKSPVAIAPIVTLAEVTDGQLTRYAELIYQRTGIHVLRSKKTLLSNRVRRRLRETGVGGFGEYFDLLAADQPP